MALASTILQARSLESAAAAIADEIAARVHERLTRQLANLGADIEPPAGWQERVHAAVGTTPLGPEERIAAALDLIVRYGGIDGEHHKRWVIDQVARVLAGDGYAKLVADACAGKDGPATFAWDVGIAP